MFSRADEDYPAVQTPSCTADIDTVFLRCECEYEHEDDPSVEKPLGRTDTDMDAHLCESGCALEDCLCVRTTLGSKDIDDDDDKLRALVYWTEEQERWTLLRTM